MEQCTETAADMFRHIASDYSRKSCLYNLQHLENITSIMQGGILCHDLAQRAPHVSVADPNVQDRRERITVPHGLRLHQYANVYFDYWNPMLSRIRSQNNSICILAVSCDILNVEGAVITDCNAASLITRFYAPHEISKLPFDRIFARSWIHDGNEHDTAIHRLQKCAEILVPECIPFDHVLGAIVFDTQASKYLKSIGFMKYITTRPSYFF